MLIYFRLICQCVPIQLHCFYKITSNRILHNLFFSLNLNEFAYFYSLLFIEIQPSFRQQVWINDDMAHVLIFFFIYSRISLHSSKKSSTRSTTRRGIASWAATSARTWRMRPATSSTSTWGRWPSCCSRAASRPAPPPRARAGRGRRRARARERHVYFHRRTPALMYVRS